MSRVRIKEIVSGLFASTSIRLDKRANQFDASEYIKLLLQRD